MEIAVAGDVEPLGDGAGPVGLGFGPSVKGGVQNSAPGKRVKGHVRVDLHGAGTQGLGQQGRRRPRVGRGRGNVIGQGRCRGFDGQRQDAAHHGGGLGKPLIAHVVVQQRVDEDARPCPGFAGEHVGLEALPGDFLLHRVDAAVDGFDFREGDHAHAVGEHGAGAAPRLAYGGDGQERRGHAGAARGALGGHALQPDELPFLIDRQPVEARQGLPVGDEDGGAVDRAFDAEAVGVQPLGFGADHALVGAGIGRAGGGLVARGGPVHGVAVFFIVRPRRVDGITLTALDDGDDGGVRQGVGGPGVAAVDHADGLARGDAHGLDVVQRGVGHRDTLPAGLRGRGVGGVHFRVDAAQVGHGGVGQAAGGGHVHAVAVDAGAAFRNRVDLMPVGVVPGHKHGQAVHDVRAARRGIAVVLGDALGERVQRGRGFLGPQFTVVHGIDDVEFPVAVVAVKAPRGIGLKPPRARFAFAARADGGVVQRGIVKLGHHALREPDAHSHGADHGDGEGGLGHAAYRAPEIDGPGLGPDFAGLLVHDDPGVADDVAVLEQRVGHTLQAVHGGGLRLVQLRALQRVAVAVEDFLVIFRCVEVVVIAVGHVGHESLLGAAGYGAETRPPERGSERGAGGGWLMA